MNSSFPSQDPENRLQLNRAARDFFFFQNRGYPRKPALEWVGNRYELAHLDRQLLHRGVFSQKDALNRLASRSRGAAWEQEWLVVDGHNVQITVESFLLGRPMLKANDGVIRDLAGQSASFRLTEASWLAMDLLFRFLEEFRPARASFLFDSPISQSGLLADSYKRRMKALGLKGTAQAVPVPERDFPYAEALVASSDQAVLDSASRWVDLAQLTINFQGDFQPMTDFSPLLLCDTACRDPVPTLQPEILRSDFK